MMLTAAVLTILLHQVSAYEFLYPEIEYLGGSCFPQDSCRNTRNEDEDHLWGNYTCECGEHCIRYGTCCADSPYFGKVLHMEYRGEACKKLPNVTDTILSVFQCSDRWRYGFQIREKCEIPELGLEDPVAEAPVTSLETFVTYKNYYCAQCNYDDRNIAVWNIAVDLRKKQTVPGLSLVSKENLLKYMFYNASRRSWGLPKDGQFHEVKIQFKLPPALQKFVKKCYPKMVTRCDASHADNFQLQYKCLSYYAPIRIKPIGSGMKKYRNVHCAICNNVNVTAIDMDICKLEQQSKTAKPFSFALLLDINRNDGDTVGLKKICAFDQKWDPFFKKCRSLVCVLPGHVVRDGKCEEG